jgi:hypothetical protein
MRKHAYFPSPFDVTESGLDATVLNELLIAGVPALLATPKDEFRPEFRTYYLGALWFASGVVVGFSRAHRYWCVSSSAPLPYVEAKVINDRMGRIVRVEGMSGGTNVQTNGCAHWNVDAQEGLNTLVQALKDHFGSMNENQQPTTAMLANMGLVNNAIYG